MTENKSLAWLKANKQFLSVRAIEIELKMGDSTLAKSIAGTLTLPERYVEALDKWVSAFRGSELSPVIKPETAKTVKKSSPVAKAVEKPKGKKEMPAGLSKADKLQWLRENK